MSNTVNCAKCNRAMSSTRGERFCLACGAFSSEMQRSAKTLDMQPKRTAPAKGLVSPKLVRVSNDKRKTCGQCGGDVTFARRLRNAAGQILCERCGFKEQQKPGDPYLESAEDLKALLPSDTSPGEATNSAVLDELAEAHSDTHKIPRPARNWDAIGIVLMVVVPLLAISLSIWWFSRPDWDQLNKASLLALKTDADRLSGRNDPKGAYRAYQLLFERVGNHQVQDILLRSDLESARKSMDRNFALAKPIIEREEAETRAREEAERQREITRQRQEKERIAREEADRARLENERKAAVVARENDQRRQAEERNHQRMLALARQQFRKTEHYRILKARANDIVKSLATDMLVEDSAFRSMSRRSRASRDLLAIYVEIACELDGKDVSQKVERLLTSADSDMAGEDSAIRGTYKGDRAFFEILGIWCEAIDERYPGIAKAYASETRKVSTLSAGDDSAIRAIYFYTGGSLNVLKEIVSRKGDKTAADMVASDAGMANAGDDSAWRVAMNNAKGVSHLMLVLLEQTNRGSADRIRRATSTTVLLDDSALRIQSQYKQATVDTLKALIDSF